LKISTWVIFQQPSLKGLGSLAHSPGINFHMIDLDFADQCWCC